MTDITYCNNLDLKKDCDSIYKYFPLKYLVSLLESRYLFFNKITSWEDPYENFFLKQVFTRTDGTLIDREIIEKCFNGFYGQCWTKEPESDAMWRIYSHFSLSATHIWDLGNAAIKIKVLREEIVKQVSASLKSCSVSLQDVEYLNGANITDWLRSLPIINRRNMVEYILKSLYIKRTEFEHEKEVRLFIHRPSVIGGDKSNLMVEINPTELIQEYVVDPRLSESQCNLIESYLLKLGIDKSKVMKSKLYSINESTLVVDAQS